MLEVKEVLRLWLGGAAHKRIAQIDEDGRWRCLN